MLIRLFDPCESGSSVGDNTRVITTRCHSGVLSFVFEDNQLSN